MDSCARPGRRRLLAAAASLLGTMALGRPFEAAAAGVEAHEPLALPLRDLGPRLIDAGAIDPERFIAACVAAGFPLSRAQRAMLVAGAREPIELHGATAHFVLNFFWAAGLANANPLLARGPMLLNGMSRISGYASTGGWSLGARPVMELYGQHRLMPLGDAQQARLEHVAARVYRPCCDNPTSFPDCNHGMAMLGLLTRLAAEDLDIDAMFQAASIANAHWFPREAGQVARFLAGARGAGQARVDPRLLTGRQLFSAAGFAQVASWAAARGLTGAGDAARC